MPPFFNDINHLHKACILIIIIYICKIHILTTYNHET